MTSPARFHIVILMSKKDSPRNFLVPFILVIGGLIVGAYFYNLQNSPAVLSASNNAAAKSTPVSNNAAITYPKEFFVPFGYGSFTNSPTDWTDVPGMQVTIDSWQYPRLKQALFEATVYSPNGNQTVELRLRNYDGWSYPKVTMTGTGPNLLTTDPFSISPGPKTYYVQLKTQLGYPVQIYQARLHITTY